MSLFKIKTCRNETPKNIPICYLLVPVLMIITAVKFGITLKFEYLEKKNGAETMAFRTCIEIVYGDAWRPACTLRVWLG